MNVIGITAEYNPFHLGHAYHLRRVRERFGEDSTVVCVMSGDFVQRGEPAVYDKFIRAEAACRCGADLVVELPLPWCLSSAEGFARGAVGLLDALGCTHLSFGCENDDMDALSALAELLGSAAFQERVKQTLRDDGRLSYAEARQRAAADVCGERAAFLEKPNNILAIEYIKAIRTLGSSMVPLGVLRVGSAHDGDGGVFPSASALRKRLYGGEDASAFLPPAAVAVYACAEAQGRGLLRADALEAAMLSRLRLLDEETLLRLPDARDGLSQRLYRALREEPTLRLVAERTKSRRYAMARIRRLLCAASLGLRDGMADGRPGYARVLAANPRARALLGGLRKTDALALLTKPAAVKELDERSCTLFALGAAAHDLYVLGRSREELRRGGEDWRTGPFIAKNADPVDLHFSSSVL